VGRVEGKSKPGGGSAIPVGGTMTAGGGSPIPVGGTGVATVDAVRPGAAEYGNGSAALDAEPERAVGAAMV